LVFVAAVGAAEAPLESGEAITKQSARLFRSKG
jgi:hypothetical protein